MPATFTYGLPSDRGWYVPSYDTSANLIVNYGRNPKDYQVNTLAKIFNVDKQEGFYAKLDPAEYARITNPQNIVWPDGQPLGYGLQDAQGMTFLPYFTQRRAVFTTLGDLTVDQSQIPMIAQQQSVLANKMMLYRSKAFYNCGFDSNNHLASHVNTATAIGGGVLSSATASNNYIQQTFRAVATQIQQDTYGQVDRSQLSVIMSPQTAMRLAATQEIRDTLVQQQLASEQVLEGGSKTWAFGLPPVLYGIRVIIDTACEDAGPRAPLNSAAAVPTFQANSTPNYNLLFVVRQGDLEIEGNLATDFTSIAFFMLHGKEMVSEVFDIYWEKRKQLILWENWDVRMVAPETAYLVTSVFGSAS